MRQASPPPRGIPFGHRPTFKQAILRLAKATTGLRWHPAIKARAACHPGSDPFPGRPLPGQRKGPPDPCLSNQKQLSLAWSCMLRISRATWSIGAPGCAIVTIILRVTTRISSGWSGTLPSWSNSLPSLAKGWGHTEWDLSATLLQEPIGDL
jgi:hypothetical protein